MKRLEVADRVVQDVRYLRSMGLVDNDPRVHQLVCIHPRCRLPASRIRCRPHLLLVILLLPPLAPLRTAPMSSARLLSMNDDLGRPYLGREDKERICANRGSPSGAGRWLTSLWLESQGVYLKCRIRSEGSAPAVVVMAAAGGIAVNEAEMVVEL